MSRKKEIRASFRRQVFERDRYRCRVCCVAGRDAQGGEEHLRFHRVSDGLQQLDAHHVQNRNLFANGGYVSENGVSVCPTCHFEAEKFWSTGERIPGMTPDELYLLIGSDFERATEADRRLGA